MLFIHRYATHNFGIATVNRRIRSVFGQLRVANGRIGEAIGQLWLRLGGVCHDLFTLRVVKHGVWKVYRGIRYFLIRVGVVTFAVAVCLKRVWNRSKPMWNKVKEMLIWRFFAKNGTFFGIIRARLFSKSRDISGYRL